ncbi:MAG: hypothetical protein WC721_01895 [Victivallaceae bacterium]
MVYENWNALCGTAVQNGRVDCPKWFWRIGPSLAERERYTGKHPVKAVSGMSKMLFENLKSVVLNDSPKCRNGLSRMGLV